MKKRVLGLLLTLALCFTMLPAAAFAAEADPAGQETQSDSGTAVQAGETTHEHYLCGGDTCNAVGHDDEGGNKVTFTKWPGINNVGTGGAYYLTTDLSGFTVKSGVNLTICLNGCSITGSWNGPTVTVEPGATLTLCDCNATYNHGITHTGSGHGTGVLVGKTVGTEDTVGTNDAVFNMYGGYIYSNSPLAASASAAGSSSGVTVAGGMFNLYGGTIRDNKAYDYGDGGYGGVFVCNRGTFNMSGGTITGNTTYLEGAGVLVGGLAGLHGAYKLGGGTFNMTGGTITGNTAGSNGGGVYVSGAPDAHFTISGSARITDNYTGNVLSTTNSTANNVYLSVATDSKTGAITDVATIEVGALTAGASIGVTTEEVGQTVATGVSAAAKKYFFSDNSNYRLKYDSSASTLTMIAVTEHAAHPICGDASCTDSSHALPDGKSWVAVSDLSKITAAGYYYLTQNIEIDSTWQPVNGVVLCLNDYTITANGDFDAITVGKDVTFTLCDCIGGGEITHDEGKSGTGVYMKGTGSEANKKATFNMYSGTITGNTGHTVTTASNVTSIRGGGVYVGYYAQFHMSGGSITGNTADVGGGVYYDSDVARYFTVSGNVKITGNQGTDGKYNNVYVPDASGSDDGCYKFTIGEGGLGEDAEIGITFGGTLATGEKITFALHAERGYYDGNFTYDNNDGNYSFKKEADTWNDQALRGTHVVNLYNGLHEHPICGKTHKDIGDHKGDCPNVTWTAWDGVSDITYDDNYTAYVYLTTNAERNTTLEIAKGNKLYLCLNGHSLTMNKSGVAVIKVVSGATLSLCDCSDAQTGKLTHGTNDSGSTYSGRGVTVEGTFNMYGGSITGNNTTAAGGGVSLPYEAYSACFNLYGGSITNNVANNGGNDGGGGVHVLSGAFTMYGGSITGNHADNARVCGGGVYLAGPGKFVMKGGSITDNTAKNGGGVYTNVNLSTGLTVSGNVTITGNKNTDDKDENVYLASGKTIAIGADGLDENANIGVTSADSIAEGSYVTVATGANKGYTENAIFGDKDEYTTLQKGDEVRLYNGIPHEHAICGTEGCTEDGHGDLLWTGITSLDEIKGDGNYYLLQSVDTKGWACKFDVKLCLNGNDITYTAAGTTTASGIIGVSDGAALSITDCKDSGIITHGSETSGTAIYVSGGTFNLYGGTITGNGYTGTGMASGGAVYVSVSSSATEDSTFNMYGGTISGNFADNDGGGVYVGSVGTPKSTFNMYGGTISSNTAIHGGGVFVDENSVFNMSGGTISGNFADNDGGGVCVGLSDGATFQMTGGTITGNNTNLGYGGGVYVDTKSTFSISGNVKITGNCEKGEKDTETGLYIGGTVNNVHLSANSKDRTEVNVINVTGALDENAKIGVTFATSARPSSTNGGVKFAEAITESTADTTGWIKVGNFLSDESTLFVVNVMEDGKVAQLNMHEHTYDVRVKSGEANVFEWVCETEGCGNIGGTLTLEAEDKSYTGSAYTGAKLTAENWGNGFVGTSIAYEEKLDDGTFKQLDEAPTNAGSYRASITLKNKAGDDVTATKEFTISRAKLNLNAGDFKFNAPDDLLYNDKAKVATVTWLSEAISKGFGDITVKYYDKDGKQLAEAPTNAGTYTVKIDVAEGVGYEAQTDIYHDDWTFIINQVQQKLTFKYSTVNMIYGEGPFTNPLQENDIQGTITYKSSNENVAKVAADGTVTILAAVEGTVTITAETTGTDNYSGAEASFTLTVAKKGITVSGITAKDKYYDGNTDAELDCSKAVLDGKLDKDDLSVTAKGAFEDVNAGENKTVEITDLTLTGNDAGNYILVDSKDQQKSTTATINKMPLHITGATAEGRDYRKDDTSVTVTGVTFADNGDKAVTLMLGTDYTVSGTMDSADAGIIKDVAVKVTLSDSTAKNYSLDSDTIHVKVTINRMKIAIPTADATKFTYTGSDQTYTLTGLTEGYCSISGNVRSAAGDHTVIVSLTDKDNTEWTDGKQDDITFTFHIEKVDGAVTAPTGKTDLRYAGEALELLETPAATDFGTVEYKLDGGDWSAEMPTATNAGEYTVYYRSTGDGNHNATNGTDHITVQIAQAKTTGEPKYTPITSAGKTLEDAKLTLVDSTLDPPAGSLIWIDEDGNALGNDTEVEANKAYGWQFTPSDINYAPLTGEIVPYRVTYTPSYPVNVPEETEHGAVTSSVERAFWGNLVTITVKPDSGYVLETLTVTDQNGKELELTDKGDGVYTFAMPSGEVTIKAAFMEDNSILNFFIDVPNDAYYYEAVKWAVENGITNGVGYNLFAPGRPCTRAQIVTFLWRAAGSPEPKSMTSFSDVPADSYYAKAVAWAVENGIALGVSADRFAPDDTCTRAHAVTFLARALNGKAEGKAEFIDVSENSYYAGAVAWASENGVTEGIGMGKFGPNSDCTRGQIVTFLYRAYNK